MRREIAGCATPRPHRFLIKARCGARSLEFRDKEISEGDKRFTPDFPAMGLLPVRHFAAGARRPIEGCVHQVLS